MPILLNNSQVEQLLTPANCLEALEEAYVDLGKGAAGFRPRSDLYVDSKHDQAFYRLRTMEGASASLGVAAIRMGSDVVRWHEVDGEVQQSHLPVAHNGGYVGIVMVFDVQTSEPQLIFPDGALQRLRVGATSALAAKYLARKDSRRLAILGAGNQARGLLLSMAAALPLSEVRVYSPTANRRESFSREMSVLSGLDVRPVASLREAMEGADVLSCCTNSLEPVVRSEWLEPGMHLGAIEWCELEDSVYARADKVVIHVRSQVDNYMAGVRASDITGLHKHDLNDWSRNLPGIADIIGGQVTGRSKSSDITCFVNNVGCGLQFAATGKRLYDLARAQGVGRELPIEWFVQDIPS